MTPNQLDTIKEYINSETPFGPINAAKIENSEAAQLLFDRENRIYKSLTANPSIIVGRRGSGKTAYLRGEHFSNRYDIVIECTASDSFATILRRVHDGLTEDSVAEEVAAVWETMFHLLLFDHLIFSPAFNRNELKLTRDYMAKIGHRNGQNVEEVLWNLIDTIAAKATNGRLAIAVNIIKVFDNVRFEDAYKEAIAAMRSKRLKAILLLDNLEDFPIDAPLVAHAMTGLLRCVGAFNKPRCPFYIRFCLPAELYHVFLDLAANPIKDFERHIILHWHSTELLSIAARRIQIYAELYHEELSARVSGKDIGKRKEAQEVFHAIFPEQITNAFGNEEGTLGYILRHTQLLPRHLLYYLNEISGVIRRLGGNMHAVTPKAVRDGIARTEGKIVNDIFNAFKRRFPKAREICSRCIPELPLVFSYGMLQEVYTRHGKVAISEDFFYFKNMLVEIGAVGRVLSESEKYKIGLFEYNAPLKLIISTDDELCLHPIFASVFNCRLPKNNVVRRPIMPYGSELETPDEREFWS
jgi:hypothetical protein